MASVQRDDYGRGPDHQGAGSTPATGTRRHLSDRPELQLLTSYGALVDLDAVGVHGFPLDWNHWQIQAWPKKIKETEDVRPLPVWVTEVGASSFGTDGVQVFGIERMNELLIGRVAHIFWYSLLDLPPTWEATTRHEESEGSAYYRHFYLGLVDTDVLFYAPLTRLAGQEQNAGDRTEADARAATLLALAARTTREGRHLGQSDRGWNPPQCLRPTSLSRWGDVGNQ